MKDVKTQLMQLADLMQAERSNMLRYACYRLGDPEEAADVLQDVYISVHTQIYNDDSVKILNLKSYLFRSLSNHCIDRLQNRSKRIVLSIDTVHDIADVSEEYSEADYVRVTKMLALLPEEQAEVIRLRIYGGKSFVDIAAILALPLSTEKSRFIYGLNKLRKYMNEESTVSHIKHLQP